MKPRFELGRPLGFTYSVDGVIVTKSIQRQPLTLDNYSGTYHAVVTQTWTASCFVEDITSTVPLVLEITQNEQSDDFAGFHVGWRPTVHGRGNVFSGKSKRFQATVACVTGDVGTIVLSEMNIHVGQINAVSRVENRNGACPATGRGRIAGVIPN